MESWVSSVTPRISFVSKSESIREAEEFDEIEQLQSAGKSALSDGDGALALRFYSEALEVDGANVESLCGHCLAFLLTGAVDEARQDAKSVMNLAAQNPRGYYLEALCLEHEMRYEDSLKVLLHAFNLQNVDDCIISERILSVAQKCLKEPYVQTEDLLRDKCDDFETLCDAGKILLAAERPELAVDVLVNAMKLDGRRTQTAVAKQRLLLGKSLVASKNLDAAILSFKDCLKSCASCEDSSVIRVEALSQLAGVHMKVGDLLHAIICYEKLFDLANESCDRSTGQVSFLCGIHQNLSFAYRTVGDLELAKCHAQLAHSLSETDLQSPLRSEVRLNLGILAEAMGDYREAVSQFECCRKLCKQLHDENGLMISYGCLGNVYARLDCYHLAAAYHKRHVALASKLRNRHVWALAKEMEGDSLILLHRYSAAVRSYQQMLRLCEDGSILSRVCGYFKLGKAYLFDSEDYSARLCFEKALSLLATSGSGFDWLITQIELCLASILMDSGGQEDLENAKQIYSQQIRNLEHELTLQSEHAIKSRLIEVKMQLKECIHGLVHIFSKMENYHDALVHIERLNYLIFSSKPLVDISEFNTEECVIKKLISIADHFRCSVIYYFLLPKVLLIWFLSADGRILHVKRDASEYMNIISEAESLIKSMLSYLSSEELLYSSENRALPLKQTDWQTSLGTRKCGGEILLTRSSLVAKNNRSGCKTRCANDGSVFESKECLSALSLSDNDTCGVNKGEGRSQKVTGELETDSAERRLYDLLVSPIETVLQDACVADDHVIIVPCDELNRCPFWSLCNKDGLALGKMYHITVTGSLMLLNTSATNSERDLQTGSDCGCTIDAQVVLSERSCGDFPNYSASFMPTPICCDSGKINPKCTSNPRLAVLSSCCNISSDQKKSKGQSGVSPLHSCADVVTRQEPTRAVREKLENTSSSSEKQKFVVIGAPSLPKFVVLDGSQSTLIIEESRMKAECVAVADLLGTNCVIGDEATKDRFLQELKSATILHIATLFSPERGDLAMSPDSVSALGQQTVVDEALYLVKADEIVATMTSAKLVVISGGWSVVSQRGMSASQALTCAFLSAGACCVLGIMYPVPSEVLACFYEGFYRALLSINGKVSTAFRKAVDHVNMDERFRKSGFSSAFALIGVDAIIDKMSVSQSMILHSITRAKDLAKEEAELPTSSETINLERDIHKIQQFLSSLLSMTSFNSELLLHLTEMLEVGSASSRATKPHDESMILPDDLCQNVVTIKLLKFLGFTFQPPEGASISHPYVLVPCNDYCGLLHLCLKALRAVNVLASNCKCLMAIQQLLPFSPLLAADLANLLSLYESDPAAEVRTTDQQSHSFSAWKDTKIRTLLKSLGFHCIGHILHFRNTAKNRNLLHEMCQLLRILVPCAPLPSNNKMWCFGGSWATEVESSVRMEEKIQLSSRVKEENDQMRSDLVRAMTWHKAAAAAQGRDVLHRKYSKTFFTRPLKVKVAGGSTPSHTRIPVDHEVIMDLKEMEQRRDYAHFVYTRRLDQVRARHRGTVSNLVLPHLLG